MVEGYYQGKGVSTTDNTASRYLDSFMISRLLELGFCGGIIRVELDNLMRTYLDNFLASYQVWHILTGVVAVNASG